MPRADSPSGSIKEEPQQIDSDTADELDQYDDQQEEIHGNGATGRFSNNDPERITGQDQHIGAGKSNKVEEVDPNKSNLQN